MDPTDSSINIMIIPHVAFIIASNDYTAVEENLLMFTPGVNISCTTEVLIINDDVLEDNQTFNVVLSTTDSDILLDIASTTITIVDNDGKIHSSLPSLSVPFQVCVHCFISDVTVGLQQSSYSVSEDDQDLMICVILSGQFEREVVVSICTEDGSALGEL